MFCSIELLVFFHFTILMGLVTKDCKKTIQVWSECHHKKENWHKTSSTSLNHRMILV